MINNKRCKIENCGGVAVAKQMCNKHYTRTLRGVTDMSVGRLHWKWKPDDPRYKNKGRLCDVPDCGKSFYANGLCRSHYNIVRNNGFLASRIYLKGNCKVDDCNKNSFAKGYCRFHYTRKNNGVSFDRPKGVKGNLNHNWNGGVSEYTDHYKMKKARINVLNRDNFTCHFCTQKAMEIHHLDLSKDNHEMSNLVACCHSCNMKHKKVYNSKYRKQYGKTIKEISLLLNLPYQEIRFLHEYNTLDMFLK